MKCREQTTPLNIMATAILIIKRSTNIHSWQNRYIGRKVEADITESGYEVVFAKNKHLKDHSDMWVQGHLDHEDHNTMEDTEMTRNPEALR